jgi:hypothetical protein
LWNTSADSHEPIHYRFRGYIYAHADGYGKAITRQSLLIPTASSSNLEKSEIIRAVHF